MNKTAPSPELIRRLVDYNPSTGLLYWKERSPDLFRDGQRSAEHCCAVWNSANAGKPAFKLPNEKGYLFGTIRAMRMSAHRVAWAHYHGCHPAGVIDHINGDRTDNRIENLRDVSQSENMRNAVLSKRNKTGCPGVQNRGDKWHSTIQVDKNVIFLGSFDSLDDAVTIRKQAEADHGFTARHGSPAPTTP